ncbi:beta-N-acetylhexosaminidase [Amycolatopsis thermoflava]|uniref:beta-N-acetylhexosaminidase n=1 Tax=Amycolatopsis thermoflava TaxID=84480 RepID=A0A3N2GNE6_9PSEU|nr:beta-N-acetylhexosaminidase [Amycolatopsis thermoflava]ROS38148.1 hexosaminidase [Amycolatopsis thermoflava]
MIPLTALLPRPVSITPAPGTCRWPAPVEVRAADLPAEGYRLTIRPDGVLIEAPDAAGEFYARQTLRQLIGPDAFRAVPLRGTAELACGTVLDHPRFAWRGCLLDVARHFRTKAEVLRFADLLAAHKLNVLHLHLTDDQGWRVEIPAFPRLTEVGSWRRESMVGRHDGPERDGRPHGGFYTGDDLREIVAYAAARAITVVPEIDVPGHSRAAIAAYPELGGGRELDVWTSWGVSTDLLDPSESTVEFFRTVFDEVLDIFPSEVIGVGGDEAPGATPEHGKFTARMIEHLHARGRRAHAWDEVLDTGTALPAGTVIGAWRDETQVARAIEAGCQVVACPEQAVYLDHRQADGDDEPVPVGFVRTLADVHRWEPPPGVLGAQAQVWTEHLDSVRRVDYATFPRLCAFAEVVWSPPDRDHAEFHTRLAEHHLPRLDALGVEYRPLDGPRPWQRRPGVPGRPR